MGAFRYEALDTDGKTITGIAEGDVARHVRLDLRAQGLTPLTVEALARTQRRWTGGLSVAHWRKEISSARLSIITRQFATLIRAGLPVDEALSALTEQTDDARARNVLASMRSRVREGQPLGKALAGFPRTFPEIYLRLVETGEQSGRLDDVLDRLADYMENRQALQQKVVLAMVYPALLTTVAVAVVTGLLVSVVPQVTRVFQNTGQVLPLSTRVLISASAFLRSHALAFLAAVVVLPIVAVRWGREGNRWHRLQLRLPLVGRLVRGLNAARLANTLGILTASGVPLLNALRSGVGVVTNRPMRSAVENAVRELSEGKSLSKSLGRSQLFPPILVHLIASGEASGNLEVMLQRAAEAQRRELEAWVAALTALLEPMLIIAMGVVVLFIVLAILSPIVQMNQLVK